MLKKKEYGDDVNLFPETGFTLDIKRKKTTVTSFIHFIIKFHNFKDYICTNDLLCYYVKYS